MSRLAKIKAGANNIRIIPFPGTGEDVALRILSGAEIQAAVFAAEERFKKFGVDIKTSTYDAYEDERTTQLLFRQLRDPENPKDPFALSADEVREKISKEEKSALVEAYELFEIETSPRLEKMSPAQFDELWAALKKTPETALNGLSSLTLKRLLLYLALRPATSPTDSGSTSSP